MRKESRKYKLEGQRFDRLLVLDYNRENKKYNCKCDCGNYKEVPSGDLRSGAVKSCGCLHAERVLDLVGQKFNMLTVVQRVGTIDGQYFFRCICDCGNEITLRGTYIKSGKANSCGCAWSKKNKEINTIHGMSSTRIYAIYSKMKLRCYSENSQPYKDYGARGIKICDEWLGEDGFLNFYNWAIENGYENNLSIDRIENNGDYEPSNCRWATKIEQANNKRSSLFYTYNGETKTLTEWCKEFGLKYDSVRKRINNFGYSFEKAITHNINRVKINN